MLALEHFRCAGHCTFQVVIRPRRDAEQSEHVAGVGNCSVSTCGASVGPRRRNDVASQMQPIGSRENAARKA